MIVSADVRYRLIQGGGLGLILGLMSLAFDPIRRFGGSFSGWVLWIITTAAAGVVISWLVWFGLQLWQREKRRDRRREIIIGGLAGGILGGIIGLVFEVVGEPTGLGGLVGALFGTFFGVRWSFFINRPQREPENVSRSRKE